MRVWRLSHSKWAPTTLLGEGARRVGGRWNPPGRPLVYASSALSLAALEMLVHMSAETLPDDYVSIAIDVPDDVAVERLDPSLLPPGWNESPVTPACRELAVRWLDEGKSVGLVVPSAVVPSESNVLLNPLHPDIRRVTLGAIQPFRFDPRLRPTAPPPEPKRRIVHHATARRPRAPTASARGRGKTRR